MPLVDMKAMLLHAYDSGYAVGAVDLVSLAHTCGVPVEGETGYVPGVEGEDAARHPVKITYTTVREALDDPIVIHGRTSLADDQFRRLIAKGVAKVNDDTALSDAAAKQINENTSTATSSGFSDLVKNIRTVVAADAERCTRLADKPTQAEPQGHYPLGLRWSTDNAFVKIHVRHREAA